MASKPKSSRTAESALPPLKIRAIAAAPLFGESPKGWSNEIRPEDSIHAIIAIHTENGPTGYGSVFTDGRLAQAGLEVLKPLVIGENALEPARIAEKLHQNTFWMGRGGTLTHTISGIDIALWDILGKATRPSRRPAPRRHATAAGQALRLAAHGRAREDARRRRRLSRERLPRLQDRLGPVRPAHDEARRSDRPRRARCASDRTQMLFVDAGASDAYWPHGLKWALRTAEMLKDYDVGWFEEALRPTRSTISAT